VNRPVNLGSAHKIDVIIPAYNQASYLLKAIQSVLEQTYLHFKLTVVDDGSTDDTPKILNGVQDTRVHVIRQPNAGLSAARNTGLLQSAAPLVTFLDADDYFLPDKLEVLSDFLDNHPHIGLVAGKVKYIDDLGNSIARPELPQAQLNLPELLYENPICVSGVLLRRIWLDRVGVFDETLRACEDWDLWLRLLAAGCPMAWVENPVVAYRIHPGQMTGQSQRMQAAIFTTLDKFFNGKNLFEYLAVCKDSAYASGWIHSAAFAYLSDDFSTASHNLEEALRLDPALKVNHYKKLVGLLLAWSHDPRSIDPAVFLQQIIAHPPQGHPGLRLQLRRALADVMLGSLFRSSRDTWPARRGDLLKAVIYKPDWLFNRGVLRMIAEAWLR
jgi:glycosyltransferase involved in cell wall biosynthesis